MTAISNALAFLDNGLWPGEAEATAYWLKSPYTSLEWQIGKYNINWERGLPDGTLLSDPANYLILGKIKRIVFEVRNSDQSKSMNNEHFYRRINLIFCLLDWTIYNKDRYNPALYGLASIDTSGLLEFVTLFAQGGPNEVSYIRDRIISIFRTKILSNSLARNMLNDIKQTIPSFVFNKNIQNLVTTNFEEDEITIIKTWLYINQFYEFTCRGKNRRIGMVNRGRLSQLLEIRNNSFSSKVDVFLRQFEFVEDYNEIELNNRFRSNEFIPCNAFTVEESSIKPLCDSQLKELSRTLASLKRISGVVDSLPAKEIFESINVETIAMQQNISETNHFRTTPIPIALHVLNEAIGFVMVYGESLVELSLTFGRKLSAIPRVKQTRKLKDKLLAEIPIPVDLIPLNISSSRSHYSGRQRSEQTVARIAASKLRDAMPLEDAIITLITSVYIVIAVLTARRKTEICSLQFDCVTGSLGQYEITFGLAKANFDESRTVISRPIPNMLAKAIDLIKHLSVEWTAIFGISNSDKLFLVPFEFGQGSPLNDNIVDTFLDRFCDYIEVPVDENNRRWYVRTHECRRFFAIVFFWQFKYANLTALSWMLGHVDPQHTYAYIKESIGGAELTKEEARFTAAAIKGDCDENELQKLRLLVQNHFHASDVHLIDENDLELYLEDLLEQGAFEIKPHSIETEEGVAYEILFEICREV